MIQGVTLFEALSAVVADKFVSRINSFQHNTKENNYLQGKLDKGFPC